MHLHRNGEHRVALILLIMAITSGISWASTQCKMVVMDVHMKRCRPGAGRTKRAMERLDLQKYDEKFQKKQEGPDYSMVNDSISHDAPQKRQLTSGRNVALPIVMETVNGATRARTYTASGAGYYDPGAGLVGRTYGRPGYYSSSSYPLDRSIPFRVPALSEDVALDLNNEELEELYNDIYERLPRASKEEAWKAFLETASKCCQNIDKCKKETTHIPCLAV